MASPLVVGRLYFSLIAPDVGPSTIIGEAFKILKDNPKLLAGESRL